MRVVCIHIPIWDATDSFGSEETIKNWLIVVRKKHARCNYLWSIFLSGWEYKEEEFVWLRRFCCYLKVWEVNKQQWDVKAMTISWCLNWGLFMFYWGKRKTNNNSLGCQWLTRASAKDTWAISFMLDKNGCSNLN